MIIIKFANYSIKAELNNSSTAKMIKENLPLNGKVSLWGKEAYFSTKLKISLENSATDSINLGDIAFWPSGKAICFFYGKTPLSIADKPKAVSPVNVFGKIDKNYLKYFDQLNENDEVLIELKN